MVGGEAPSGAIDGVGSAGSGGRWDKGSDSGGLASSEGVKDHQQQEQEDYPDLDSYVEDNLMQGDEVSRQSPPPHNFVCRQNLKQSLTRAWLDPHAGEKLESFCQWSV